MNRPLWAALLGLAFDALPASLRELHSMEERRVVGLVTVQRGHMR